MKKFTALLLALLLASSLVACGSSPNDKIPSSGEPSVMEPVTPPSSTEEGDGIADGSTEDTDTAPDAPASGGATVPGGSTSGTTSGTGTSDSKPATKPEAKPETKPTPKPEAKPETPAPAEKTLSELVDSIMDGVDAPNYMTTDMTAEMFPNFLFIEQPTGATAVTADALIGSIAHSVVLMRLPADVDMVALAKQVKDNANPGKWICVHAEKVEVSTKGNLLLLVMSSTATADAILANFNNLAV